MTTRDRYVLGVLAAVALLAAYWLLLLAPKKDDARRLGGEVTKAQQEVSDARAELSGAQSAKRGYARNYATIARLGQAVPADDNVPSLVFQLEAAAHATHVDFRAVKLKSSGSSAAPAPPAAPSSSSGSSSSSSSSSSSGSSDSSSSSTSTANAPATQAATSALPPGATVGAAGFPTMPFSLTFDGSFFHMSSFFHRLENFVQAGGRAVRVGGRLLTLDGISFTASRHGFPRVKAVVSATAYLIPEGEGATGGATASTPASTATTPPAATSSEAR